MDHDEKKIANSHENILYIFINEFNFIRLKKFF